jgi:hypothetical protein
MATHAAYLAHPVLDMITIVILGEKYKLGSFSLYRFLQPADIVTFFPYTLNLCSSRNLKDHVSHLYKRIDQIKVVYNFSLYVSRYQRGRQ